MELHFLGRGAAFYVEAGNTSAYPVSYTHLTLPTTNEV